MKAMHRLGVLGCAVSLLWSRGALSGEPASWMDDVPAVEASAGASDVAPPLAIVLGVSGGVGLVLATASGVATAVMQAEVERRAERQLLVFPRDAALVRTGTTLAAVTNGLAIGGAALVAGGIYVWMARGGASGDEEVRP